MKTYQPKHKDIKRDWHLLDANGKVLGRLATEAVKILMGKHKANYSGHMDMGDNVVVINAEKVEVTGRKELQKSYFSHSGYPSGLKEVKYAAMKKKNPARIIELAVGGMLPKNRLRDKRLKRLRIYAGEKHDYGDKFKEVNSK